MGDKNPNIAAIILKGLNIPRRELRLSDWAGKTNKKTNKHMSLTNTSYFLST